MSLTGKQLKKIISLIDDDATINNAIILNNKNQDIVKMMTIGFIDTPPPSKTVMVIKDIEGYYYVVACNDNGLIQGLRLSDGYWEAEECFNLINNKDHWTLYSGQR